jgi:hypothetical protein
MDTKLTLKLNKEVIEKAKTYAALHNRSLSGIIESYLMKLVNNENTDPDNNNEISPFVKSMRSGVRIPSDLDATQL